MSSDRTHQPRGSLGDEHGQTMAEYALVLSLIAATCVLALGAVGADVIALFNQVLPGFA